MITLPIETYNKYIKYPGLSNNVSNIYIRNIKNRDAATCCRVPNILYQFGGNPLDPKKVDKSKVVLPNNFLFRYIPLKWDKENLLCEICNVKPLANKAKLPYINIHHGNNLDGFNVLCFPHISLQTLYYPTAWWLYPYLLEFVNNEFEHTITEQSKIASGKYIKHLNKLIPSLWYANQLYHNGYDTVNLTPNPSFTILMCIRDMFVMYMCNSTELTVYSVKYSNITHHKIITDEYGKPSNLLLESVIHAHEKLLKVSLQALGRHINHRELALCFVHAFIFVESCLSDTSDLANLGETMRDKIIPSVSDGLSDTDYQRLLVDFKRSCEYSLNSIVIANNLIELTKFPNEVFLLYKLKLKFLEILKASPSREFFDTIITHVSAIGMEAERQSYLTILEFVAYISAHNPELKKLRKKLPESGPETSTYNFDWLINQEHIANCIPNKLFAKEDVVL